MIVWRIEFAFLFVYCKKRTGYRNLLTKERIKKEGSTNCWMKKRFMMKLEIIRLNCVWTKTIRFQRKNKSRCNLNIHTFLTNVWLRYGWKTLMKLSEKASNETKNRFLTVNDYNFEQFDLNSNSSRCVFLSMAIDPRASSAEWIEY